MGRVRVATLNQGRLNHNLPRGFLFATAGRLLALTYWSRICRAGLRGCCSCRQHRSRDAWWSHRGPTSRRFFAGGKTVEYLWISHVTTSCGNDAGSLPSAGNARTARSRPNGRPADPDRSTPLSEACPGFQRSALAYCGQVYSQTRLAKSGLRRIIFACPARSMCLTEET